MHPPPITCRDCGDDDLDAVAAVWRESWDSIGLADEAAEDVAGLRRRLVLGREEGWRITVAVQEDRIVGFLAIDAPDRHLRQLFIHPAAQGMGVGTRLLDVAREQMPDGFWLRTADANHRARAFYERRGLRLDHLAPHPTYARPTAVYAWP